jgi:hypothetical protein
MPQSHENPNAAVGLLGPTTASGTGANA